jgi:eukaryotic-like serine/threonine-protein kinase
MGLLQRVRDEPSADRAISALESILRNARESSSVNAVLARALLRKSMLTGRPALIEQATVYAVRGVALDAADPEAHVTLGEVQNATGRHAEAVRSFERALALRPNDSNALIGLGQAYEKQGRAADAEKMYRMALSARPDSVTGLMWYGTFCHLQSRYADAVRHFRRVTELDPAFPLAHSNLGGALLALGKYEEALVALEKSLALRPSAAGYSNIGTLQFTLGRYDDARQSYEQAARLAPTDFVAWANLGDACRWVPGQGARAREAYAQAASAARAALEVNPKNVQARSALALSLAYIGKADDAQSEIRRALEIDPTNAPVLYKAALIALLRDHQDNAISWIERAVANGYPARDLARDPELKTLHSLPSFRNAVQSRR